MSIYFSLFYTYYDGGSLIKRKIDLSAERNESLKINRLWLKMKSKSFEDVSLDVNSTSSKMTLLSPLSLYLD